MLIIFWRASPSEFLPKLETPSVRSREVPDTSCSSVADGYCQTGGPVLLRNGVGTLRVAEDPRFSADGGCTKGLSSSSSSETVVWSERTRGLSSSSSSSLWTGAGEADLRYERAKVTCFVGRDDRPRDFGWYARLVKFNAMCPIEPSSIGEECKPKAGHVILAPFGSSSSVIPRFFICGRENRIDRHIARLKHINSSRTWWFCRKMNNTTFPN